MLFNGRSDKKSTDLLQFQMVELARSQITKVERNQAQNSAQRIGCLIRVTGTWRKDSHKCGCTVTKLEQRRIQRRKGELVNIYVFNELFVIHVEIQVFTNRKKTTTQITLHDMINDKNFCVYITH